MRSIGLAIIIFFIAFQVNAAESYTKVKQDGEIRWTKIPMPIGVSYAPDLKNAVWHRRTTGNIEILALDDSQGIYLKENLSKVIPWLTSRWGMESTQLTAPVRILVVNDPETMTKLFKLSNSKAEPFRDYEGRTLHVVFMLFDGEPLDAIANPMTSLALAEQSRFQCGFWAKRGMGALNSSLAKIKIDMASLVAPSHNNQLMPTNKVFALTEDQWYKLKNEEKILYDRQCAALCLLLRKEFGEQNLHTFLINGGTEQAFSQVYGFSGFDEFDKSYFRYCFDISNDVSSNKTPDQYLQIRRTQ